MATENLPSEEGTQRILGSIAMDFSVKNHTVKRTDQGHNIEKTVNFYVDLLANGDIEEQREAAEMLSRLRRGREHIREPMATALLVERLSSPDLRIRQHMMTLLFRLAADEEKRYDELARAPSAHSGFHHSSTTRLIHNLLRVGPGQKAYDTAAKIVIELTNIERLQDSIAASGGVDALIEMLRFQKGLKFQKEAIATLINLLSRQGENKARAVRGGLPGVLLRLLVHGSPEECDMNGILDLIALLVTDDSGFDTLVHIKTPEALTMLIKTGKLVSQREKMATILHDLTEPLASVSNGDGDKQPGSKLTPSNLGNGHNNNKWQDYHYSVREPRRVANGLHPGETNPTTVASGPNKPQVRPSNGHASNLVGQEIPQMSLIQNPNAAAAPKVSKKKTKPAPPYVDEITPKPSQLLSHHGNGSIDSGIKVATGEQDPAATTTLLVIPEQFCCPISRQLMKDPVTVSSGENYDREFIQQWFDKGKRLCPKSRYYLRHTNLVPNITLRKKIAEWCERNGLENFSRSASNIQQGQRPDHLQEKERQQQEKDSVAGDSSSHIGREYTVFEGSRLQNGIAPRGEPADRKERSLRRRDPTPPPEKRTSGRGPGPYSANRAAANGELYFEPEMADVPASKEVSAQLDSLLDALSATRASEADLRAAALALHDLAFECQFVRDEIVKAGAVERLADLLSPHHSPSTQEAGIATLLILSLNNESKKYMATSDSNVIPAVVGLLKNGSEDGREKAASTLFSLSIRDENKVSIGATDAIPALVDILSGRDPVSRKARTDALTCLLTLSIYIGNKARAVRAGVVPYLLILLDDEGLLDLVLAMLAVLSSHPEGRQAIGAERDVLAKLTRIMSSGTDRNVENAVTTFSALVMMDPALGSLAWRLGADQIILALGKSSTRVTIRNKVLSLMEFLDSVDER